MEQRDPSESEARLDDLSRTYGAACPAPEPSVNFISNLWARIALDRISQLDTERDPQRSR
jgi:hypothetical protein